MRKAPLHLLLRRSTKSIHALRRNNTHTPTRSADSCGIPTEPTWSVNDLLSSYPSPKLSSTTINRLYELSALIPPEEGTEKYESVKRSLEDMVRLVEAVKLVDTTGVSVQGRGEKEVIQSDEVLVGSEESGQALLKHAARTQNGFYVVDSERKR